MFCVYILLCSDGTLYTGYSTDIVRRLKQHQDGKASKYTRPRLPVRLIYSEQYQSKGEALRREAEIKKLSRRQKERLIGTTVFNYSHST